MPPLRLGIIGCGGILANIYSQILLGMEARATVAAICDIAEDRLSVINQIFPSARRFTSMEQMLEQELDAVMVLTSESASARVAMQVLEAGFPVYMEKPPALNTEEFAALSKVNETTDAPLYSAFNRRHCPLLEHFEAPASIQRAYGRMSRINREFDTFPYTALHLLDSLLYYTNTEAKDVRIEINQAPYESWKVECQLNDQYPAALEFIPNGDSHCEYLVLEGKDSTVEIQFPNPESKYVEGEITITQNGQPPQTITGKTIHAHEQMGYAPALRGFLDLLSQGKQPPHAYCLQTSEASIRLMADMVDKHVNYSISAV